MEAVTYDLKDESGSSNAYYAEVQKLAKETYQRILERAGTVLDRYEALVREREPSRTRIEYATELLTLGVLYRRYSGAAACASPRLVAMLSRLYEARRRHPRCKPLLDPARGFLVGVFLATSFGRELGPAPVSLRHFELLLQWLEATGEFHDEAKRLTNWYALFRLDGTNQARDCVSTALELAAWFEGAAAWRLGNYTRGVERFLREDHPRYRLREDAIFCGKSEVEYHLNMVGAELMNLAFEGDYLRTSRRAVLVPGCMRKHDDGCKARSLGDDLVCTRCTPGCRVSDLTSLGNRNGFQVRIIVHASSFKKALMHWQGTDTGLVASACLLNLVPGGYQMRDLGLPAQCVPLDFSGCQRHWRPDGVATDLNEDRLIQIVHKGRATAAADETPSEPTPIARGKSPRLVASLCGPRACARAAACAGRR